MYMINTFGLGHNHGGTGFFIEYGYNSNISNKNYFNALQYNEAIKYFNDIALGRGDTDSVKEQPRNKIDVLIPSLIKRNPSKDHRNGCEFINLIESIIRNSDNTLNAELNTVLYTSTKL